MVGLLGVPHDAGLQGLVQKDPNLVRSLGRASDRIPHDPSQYQGGGLKKRQEKYTGIAKSP